MGHYTYGRWYDPVIVVRADSLRLEYLDAETVGAQIVRLDKIRKQGLITDREYKRLKKRLLSRMGQVVPMRYGAAHSGRVLNELDALHQLLQKGILTNREYTVQKRRMLASL